MSENFQSPFKVNPNGISGSTESPESIISLGFEGTSNAMSPIMPFSQADVDQSNLSLYECADKMVRFLFSKFDLFQ